MATCKIDKQGRITLPSNWRSEQGIEPGTELLVLEEDGRLLVQTRMQAVRRAQEMMRKLTRPGSGSAVEELFRMRREEVELEEKEERERQERAKVLSGSLDGERT